jgi:hypothetical protein
MTSPTEIDYPQRVRIANAGDEEEIMALCRDLHNENGLFKMDDNKVRGMLRRAFNREGGILGAIGAPGAIEALIYILIGEFWYSTQPHLEELFTYVAPQYRKSKNATDLLRFSKWCVETTGLPLVIGVLSNKRTEGKVRLYERQFSKPAGNFFFYEKKASAA